MNHYHLRNSHQTLNYPLDHLPPCCGVWRGKALKGYFTQNELSVTYLLAALSASNALTCNEEDGLHWPCVASVRPRLVKCVLVRGCRARNQASLLLCQAG